MSTSAELLAGLGAAPDVRYQVSSQLLLMAHGCRNGERANDFVEARTHEGRKFRMLNVVDEFMPECPAIRVDRKLKAIDVVDVLSDPFVRPGVPEHIRSDHGPEFVAKSVQAWITGMGAKTAYIALGSPLCLVMQEAPKQTLVQRASRQSGSALLG